MQGYDTNLSKTVYWSADDADLDGSEYVSTEDLDLATVKVIKSRNRLSEDTGPAYDEWVLLEDWSNGLDPAKWTVIFGVDEHVDYTVDPANNRIYLTHGGGLINGISKFRYNRSFPVGTEFKVEHSLDGLSSTSSGSLYLTLSLWPNGEPDKESWGLWLRTMCDTTAEGRFVFRVDDLEEYEQLVSIDHTTVQEIIGAYYEPLGVPRVDARLIEDGAEVDHSLQETRNPARGPAASTGVTMQVAIRDKNADISGSETPYIGRIWYRKNIRNRVVSARRIYDWSDARVGTDGELLIFEDGSGNQALFEWSNGESSWVLQTTTGDWVCIEDWSSGSIRPDLWNISSLHGEHVDYTVATDRVEFTPDASSNQSTVLEPQIRFSQGSSLKVESSLDGAPTLSSGFLYTKAVMYFSGEDVESDWSLDCQIAADNAGTDASGEFIIDQVSEIDRPSTKTSVNSDNLHEFEMSCTDSLSPRGDFLIRDVDGGSTVTTTQGLGTFDYRSPAGDIISYLMLRNNTPSGLGGSERPWIGKVWIKR